MAKKKIIKDAVVADENQENMDEVELEQVIENNEENDDIVEEKSKKEGYFTQVSHELKKVVWPSAGEVAKYTLSVLGFCIVLCLFFKGMELLAALLKELFV